METNIPIYRAKKKKSDYRLIGRAKTVCDAYDIKLIVIDERKKR